jgi:hypothetical protein
MVLYAVNNDWDIIIGFNDRSHISEKSAFVFLANEGRIVFDVEYEVDVDFG